MKDFESYQQDEPQELNTFNSREGFYRLNEDELGSLLDYFSDFPVYTDLVPILTDGQSNYWCLYIDGVLKGKICYLSHDEVSLEPRFKSLSSFIKLINANPSYSDVSDIPLSSYDYPSREMDDIDREVILQLKNIFDNESEEDNRQQVAFSIMALTSLQDIENIYAFLYDEDMYVQERAIFTLGYWKYQPARELLLELKQTALPNSHNAISIALRNMRTK